MESNSQFTAPILFDPCASESRAIKLCPLERISGTYDEEWLQDLLYEHPSLIPIEEVEPIFDRAIPVCKELPTAVGPLDLVFVNHEGLLTLVECKLWRNPEARRKVVGQILDYAQDISRWSYEDLDAAIHKSPVRAGPGLWEIASAKLGLKDEASFINKVSRHLRNGSFLLLIVGDGIRENTENIADFLQRHAGLSFAFGLVEERLFQFPGTQQILVQPRILAKTVEIGRFVVRAEKGTVELDEDRSDIPYNEKSKVRRTVSENILVEEVAETYPALAHNLPRLFQRIKDDGFNLTPSPHGGSMIVSPKNLPPGMTLNLMLFGRDGKTTQGCGTNDIGRWYLDELAKIIPGAWVKVFADKKSIRVTHRNKEEGEIRIEEVVAVQDQWMDLIKKVKDRVENIEKAA